MPGEADPKVTRSLREILSGVKLGTAINRYDFTVAVAKRAREIHTLTSDAEIRSHRKSLRRAVEQVVGGEATFEFQKED